MAVLTVLPFVHLSSSFYVEVWVVGGVLLSLSTSARNRFVGLPHDPEVETLS